MTNYTRELEMRSIGLNPHVEHTITERAVAFHHHWRQARQDEDEAKLNQLRVYAPKIGVSPESIR
jgi:hypothetical protein